MTLTENRIDLTYVSTSGWTEAAMTVVRAGRVAAEPGDGVERRHYPGQDLLLCLSGRGVIDSGGRRQNVAEGDLAWIANEAPHGHRADADDPWTLLWCRIDGPRLPVLRAALHPLGRTVTRLGRTAEALAWFERLFDTLRAPISGAETDSRLNLMVAEIVAITAGGGAVRRGLPRPLDDLTRAMRARPELPWRAGDMAAAAALSEAQIRRLFAQHLALTPRAWLRRERVILAQRLIVQGALSLQQVGERCGFCDVYHFSRAFAQETGLPPGAWRDGGAQTARSAAFG